MSMDADRTALPLVMDRDSLADLQADSRREIVEAVCTVLDV
jgi:hypothetical protein